MTEIILFSSQYLMLAQKTCQEFCVCFFFFFFFFFLGGGGCHPIHM